MGAFLKNPIGTIVFLIAVLILVTAYMDTIIKATAVTILLILTVTAARALLKYVGNKK